MQSNASSERFILCELRLISAIPLPPFVAGLMVSLLLIGLVAILSLALGVPLREPAGGVQGGFSDSFRNAAVVSLLIGYTMGAGRYLNLAIFRDLQQAGQIGGEIDAQRDSWRVLSLEGSLLGRSRAAGVVGGLVGVLLHVLASYRATESSGVGPLAAANLWSLFLTPLACCLLARAAFQTAISVLGSRGRGGVAEPPSFDLLDLRPFHAQGRIGLRLSLVWIVGSTISSLYFFDPAMLAPMLPVMLIGLVVAVFALVMPARRVHRLLRETKRSELERLQPLLRAARLDALAARDATTGRFADLLAYRAYVEGLREWPFDGGTMRRFVLYLLIPIGSWLGGALVERMLGLVLDS